MFLMWFSTSSFYASTLVHYPSHRRYSYYHFPQEKSTLGRRDGAKETGQIPLNTGGFGRVDERDLVHDVAAVDCGYNNVLPKEYLGHFDLTTGKVKCDDFCTFLLQL